MKKEEIVLFISAGRTDLKLLTVDGENQYASVEISKGNQRDFHQWLRDYPEKYVVKHIPDEQTPVLYQQCQHSIGLKVDENVLRLQGEHNLKLFFDQQERCIVVPVKLGRIIAQLQEQQQFQISAAVVFNTHRYADNHFASEEPFACGPVIARWLAACFGLTFSETQQPASGQSVWVDLLTDNEHQETADKSVNPSVINKLANTFQVFSNDSSFYAVLCGTGGIPRFKTLIRDSAYFYFDNRCLLAEDTEQNNSPLITPIASLHVTPEQSFALRASVAKLISSGDFLGAEAAIRHVQDQEHLAWTVPIKMVADFFRGSDIHSYLATNPSQLSQLLVDICHCNKRSILPALRTEAALQSKAWTEALGWTSTFYDAALLDAIEKLLDGWGNRYYVKINDRDVTFYLPNFTLENHPRSSDDLNIPKDMLGEKGPLKKRGKLFYLLDTMGENEKKWLKEIKCDAMTQFNKAFYKQTSPFLSPAQYRNICTHGLLKSDELNKAIEVYNQQELWGLINDNTEPPYFLSQPLIADILKHVGADNTHEWYEEIVRLLLDAMYSFRL